MINKNILYKELSHTIIGIAMRVHTKLGAGLPEHCYSRAMAIEFDDNHIPGAILIPLFELRNRMDELDKSKRYVVYCHGGGRSAVATLVLSQHQYDVVSLDGGIRD